VRRQEGLLRRADLWLRADLRRRAQLWLQLKTIKLELSAQRGQ
jgi:hypothetical protein